MARSSAEILAPARTELARGRPRAALKELEAARAELLAVTDAEGLGEIRELTREVRTLAPVDAKTRERLLAALEQDLESLPASAAASAAETTSVTATAPPATPRFTPYRNVSTEQILAPVRTEIEMGSTGRALRQLEKARRKLLARSDLDGLGELLGLAQVLLVTKPRHEQTRERLIHAARQNVRYLSRRGALKSGQEWSDPFAAAKPKTRLPSPPPMTRREILIAAGIVVVLAGAITTWALTKRAPQRVVHAIKCPTGEQGSPSWSPDGKEIAIAKNGSCGTQIMAVSVKSRRTRVITDRYGVLPDWSPDGSTILYHSKDGFSTVDARGGKPTLLREDDGDMGATWSPEGRRIAFVHGLRYPINFEVISEFYSTLYTMKTDGSNVRRRLGHSCNPGTPDWSPDGERLVFSCTDGVYVMRLATGKLVRIENWDYTYSPVVTSWSPDGSRIAIGYGGVEIMNADGSGAMRGIEAWNSVTDVAWSPDGEQLAFVVAGWGPTVNGLYVVDRDGGRRRKLASF
jgi:dipeptidyl aminopeptidase/acylaminoacyl peptidase